MSCDYFYKEVLHPFHDSYVESRDDSHVSNIYVTLIPFQLIVTKKWFNLPATQRAQVRDYVYQMYTHFPLAIGNLQREKTAQLIAMIGKREFPHDNPEYVNQIISLIKQKFLLGITLLKATSDELVSTKPDINSHQKKHFQSCMNVCLGQIIPILNEFLAFCVSRIKNKELTDGMFDLSLSLPFDNRFSYSAIELLQSINLIFSWCTGNLENLLTSEFLNNIFELCTWRSAYSDINLAALSTISELFYLQRKIPMKNYIAYGITELIQQNGLLDSNEQ